MKEILILKENIENIKNPAELFKAVQKVNINYMQENVLFVFLDSKNKILSSEILFKGGLNASIVDIRTIFRKALILNSNSFIMAHNHPSGDLKPSDEDFRVYNGLKKAGELMQIKILDFIIFNEKEFYSLENEDSL